MDVEDLLMDLIAIESPSGDEEAIASFLAELLEDNGFDVECQPVEEDRTNVIATRGQPRRVLTTHMDTVPGQPDRREDETCIYGRGSCDAKGAMAAMIVAAVETEVEDIALVFDVGEEQDFCGIEALRERDWPTELAVVGEPTGMDRIVGQKGLLTLELTAEGVPAHGSKPSEGENAIETLLGAIETLRDLQTEEPLFGDTRFNLAEIEGGEADNVVPPEATATVQFRTVTGNDRILQALEDLDVDVEVRHDYGPRRFVDVDGSVFPGFTEAFYWSRMADAAILQGPGSMDDAHTDEERVAKRQLKDAVTTYRQYLQKGVDT
jgi:acetylornithine deacetylase